MDPLKYLQLKFGFVPHRYLDELIALDDMITDVKRMDEDMGKQVKEHEKLMKKQGKNYNRLK